MTINILEYLMLIILILINVAFITLLERKILGYSQLRLGPNKASLIGLTQPFSDAIKLFIKQNFSPVNSNFYIYIISPVLRIFVTLLIWSVSPFSLEIVFSNFSILLFIIILRLGVYPLLMAGWASNNKYRIIGGLRGVAQTISYEIRLRLLFIVLIVVIRRLNFFILIKNRTIVIIILIILPAILIWILSIIAESNRTPFDFAEGESELVSGFNIEYMARGFALIFIAEYGIIYILARITVAIFLRLKVFTLVHTAVTTGLVFFWVWTRATYPRYRYDLLINLAWKSLLPVVLIFLTIYPCVRIIG